MIAIKTTHVSKHNIIIAPSQNKGTIHKYVKYNACYERIYRCHSLTIDDLHTICCLIDQLKMSTWNIEQCIEMFEICVLL